MHPFHSAMAMLLVIANAALAAGTDMNPIKPDVDIQARIERAASAGVDKKVTSWEQAATVEKELREIAEKRPVDLVRQILHYLVRWAPHNEDRSEAAMVLPYYFRISETCIVEAVLPYIDTEHTRLQPAVSRLMSFVEDHASPTSPPDFSAYVESIRRRKTDPPFQLIRYMFRRSPGAALLSVSRVYSQRGERIRALIWAEHLVSDSAWRQVFLRSEEVGAEVRAALEKLSKDDAWWVRLYVAEIMRQHPAFRTPELLGHLKNDPHELVREAMSFARVKPKQESKPQAGENPGRAPCEASRTRQAVSHAVKQTENRGRLKTAAHITDYRQNQ